MLHLNVLISRTFFFPSLFVLSVFVVDIVRSRKAIIKITEHLSHAIQTGGMPDATSSPRIYHHHQNPDYNE